MDIFSCAKQMVDSSTIIRNRKVFFISCYIRFVYIYCKYSNKRARYTKFILIFQSECRIYSAFLILLMFVRGIPSRRGESWKLMPTSERKFIYARNECSWGSSAQSAVKCKNGKVWGVAVCGSSVIGGGIGFASLAHPCLVILCKKSGATFVVPDFLRRERLQNF